MNERMAERLEERLRRSAQTERTLGHYELEQMLLDAADTITELHDESDCVGTAAYEVGYRNGSVHYELEHCPACKNIADLQEALEENARLRSCLSDDAENARMIMGENAKLHEELEQWHRLTAGIELPEYPITEFQPKDLERENAKLRELVRISIEHCNSGTCDECPIQGEDGSCPYADMARELGIEVEE